MSPDAAVPARDRPLRVLTFTTLYPNAARPQHGVFVENRLRQLVAGGAVSARVVAPVPWFPFTSERFGAYADFARAPRAESRHGLEIEHPRYPVVPKRGMTLAPLLLFAGAQGALARLLRAGPAFDLIDAHYVYPDGVAAVMLGRRFSLPVVVTGRGTDLNVLPDHAGPRAWIRWAARRADGLVTVSAALADRLAALGVERGHIAVLRNGVDGARFRPVAPGPEFVREGTAPLALSVGNLVPLKGHDLAIRALAELPDLRLWIAGAGPERVALERLAERLDVAGRVRFLGAVPHERMPEVYGAADVLVLASEREGWPNVLLEALACGTPVVASDVSDLAEVLSAPAAGLLLPERSPEAIAATVKRLLADPPTRQDTRRYAEGFSWDATTRGQIELFEAVLRRRAAGLRRPLSSGEESGYHA